jgi:hypothetical protein
MARMDTKNEKESTMAQNSSVRTVVNLDRIDESGSLFNCWTQI